MNSELSNLRWARRITQDLSPPFGGGERAPLSLIYGNPDPTLFPAAEMAEATARVLADPSLAPVALQYGAIQGQPNLISLLIDKLGHDEGLDLSPDNVIITNGASAAIGLAARALIDEGDVVLVEAPSFPGALSVLRRTGAELRMLPMGPEGLDIAGTEVLLDSLYVQGVRPPLLYTMPTFHNPTGLTLPEAQRGALLSLARRFNMLVLEDDAYRDLYYDAASGPLPTSLYALDREGRVIRTGTFSKILTPGMRLGWALARPEIIERMMMLKEEGGTSPFTQHVAVEYGKDGVLTSHIRALVDAYRAKRDAMLAALERYFPAEATWTHPAGGFFVWATLPPSLDPVQLAARAREEGVDYLDGATCFAGPPTTPGTYLRLSYSLLSSDDIEEAIKRLARAARSLM